MPRTSRRTRLSRPGAVTYYLATLSLPTTTPLSAVSGSAAITFTWDGTQRDAASK